MGFDATAAQLLAHYDTGQLWPGAAGLSVPAGYARALEVRTLRAARGEQARGYKIGFTNRGIWPRYQVFAPIWGTVWDSTLTLCEGQGSIALGGLCQPRIEPEAVLAFKSPPPANLTLDTLFDSLDWVAPGFEIVQSHLPGWKFGAGDAVADGALHARLLVGARKPVHAVAANARDFESVLAESVTQLHRDGAVVDTGQGSAVLDGPLHALLHFVQELRQCPGAPDVAAGDVVTTGTWTDAWPVAPGQTWLAAFSAPLAPLTVRFTP